MNQLDRIETMTQEELERGNRRISNLPGWNIFGKTLPGRACGHCNFCCIVVPVQKPLNKPGGVRCVHLKHKGCSIYQQRPDVCAAWKCAWLYQPEALILRRPDNGGYAVDCALQQIFLNKELIYVIQVWVDPARRDAHRAPELRAYLAGMAEKHRLPAIVRWPDGTDRDNADATVLFPPILTDDGKWAEITSPMITHSEMERMREERGYLQQRYEEELENAEKKEAG